MSEKVASSDGSTSSRRNRLLKAAPLAVAAALALGGYYECNKSENLKIPGITATKQGTGDKKIELSIVPIAKRTKEAGRLLVIGVNMDCPKSGVDHTSAVVEGVEGVKAETAICNSAQYNNFTIPIGNPLTQADVITIDVTTNRPDLHWDVGAKTGQPIISNGGN